MSSFRLLDLSLSPYAEILSLQETLFSKNIEAKLNHQPTENYLILCEHLPVFTLGKSGKRENILVSNEDMSADFYRINRGGDVTFHGPGQLVAYPILDLDAWQIGLAEYVRMLEEVIIQSLKDFGLKGERIENAAGIWLRGSAGDRKIAAIGIKSSRNITMHGLAVNINTDLSYFKKIVPCGLSGKGTTSLGKELGIVIDMNKYRKIFLRAFCQQFEVVNTSAYAP
jgi:lipoyl(octanoyl) transferase